MKMAKSRGDKNDKASGGMIGHRKSVFGKYADSDILSWIKGLALDPCDSRISRSSIRPLRNQTLKVRKVMALCNTEFPRRKRKLQLFLKDKFTAARRVASDQQKVTNLGGEQLPQASSGSCLLNMVDSTESFNQKMVLNSHSSDSLLTFEGNLPVKHGPSELSFLYNTTDSFSPNKDLCPFADSDESVNGSNPLSPENMNILDLPSLDLDDLVHHSNTSNSIMPKKMRLQTPRRSIRLLNFIGDHLQRMVIPVGPRFQADVPDWTGPANKGNLNGTEADSESSKWLGTRIWPMEGRSTEITAGRVGKGRPDCCSCASPRSTDCIKHHILEEKLLLQSDLGPVFLSWKFDEMGEVVSKSWTLKEQQSFESLLKMYPLSSGKNFLMHASKCLPSKSEENILSYYFNVFIPRHMSLKTRSSLKQIDSDDDEVGGNGRSSFTGSSKDVKTRFLRRPFLLCKG